MLSGGERPQVFQQVQCPSNDDMDLWSCSPDRTKYIELEKKSEKQKRTTDIVALSIPKISVPYITFQVTMVRPFILKNCGISDLSRDCPLLIHSETGQYLERDQIRTTLRSFVLRIDPDLQNITTMFVRASYATMMFRAHRSGKIFQHFE